VAVVNLNKEDMVSAGGFMGTLQENHNHSAGVSDVPNEGGLVQLRSSLRFPSLPLSVHEAAAKIP